MLHKYDTSLIDSLMELQSKLSATNLLTPMLVYDDFTTHMIHDYTDDRTLGRSAMYLLYNQNDTQDGVRQNLINLNLIERIIQILGIRYISGGSHVDGILEQVYKLSLDLYILTDKSLFPKIYNVKWSWNWTKQETIEQLNIYHLSVKILLLSLIANHYLHKAPAILYSLMKITFSFCKLNNINLNPILIKCIPLFVRAVISNKKMNKKTRNMIIILVIRNVNKKHRNILRKRLIDLNTLHWYSQGSRLDNFNEDYLHQVSADYYRFILPLVYKSVNKCLKTRNLGSSMSCNGDPV